MKIVWNIDITNGPVDLMPNQEIEIDDEELKGMGPEEVMGYVNKVVKEYFLENVSCHWTLK